jgi:alpha-mannosidase/alpha-mannosidase II/lysosomal alpha-mannosidase
MGWQLDPFGHSSATPRLFADMGFEAWMFARLDWADKEVRTAEKSMTHLWRPFSKHFGNQKQMLTGIMKSHYCWPDGFWYDTRWLIDDPFVSDKNYTTFNADQKT